MDPLVTLEQAKVHLKIRHTDEDDDIDLKMVQATEIVIDYLKELADATWTPETVPGPVQAAILIQLGELRRDRGDSDPAMGSKEIREPDGYLSPRVTRLLHRYRDPALA